MGDAGLDNVVDEKQWNNDEDSLDKEADEKFGDSGTLGDTIQGESHTRDDEMEGSDKSDREEAKEFKGLEAERDLNEFQEEDSTEQHHNVESKQNAADADRSEDGDVPEEAGGEDGDMNDFGDAGEDDHADLPDRMDIEDEGVPDEDGEDSMSISSGLNDEVRPCIFDLLSLIS